MGKTQRRRRAESKTDYKSRFALLKSEKPRLVVRKTNRYVIAQIVESEQAQDKTLVKVSSKDLLQFGWPKDKTGSLKSLHAAYLTGFLLGKKLKGQLKEAVFDMGLNRNVHGSRIFALLKGAIESGIHIPHSHDALPTEERLKSNKNLFKLLEEVKGKIK